MKFVPAFLISALVLLATQAKSQWAEIETADREPAAVRLKEAEIRKTAREKTYPGGLDEESLQVQPQLVAPQPEKTIKELQAEYFEE